MPKLLVFLAWLNPHHKISIHDFLTSKTSFFLVLDFSFSLSSFFSKGIQWNVPWKGSADSVSLVSHFLWNHKKRTVIMTHSSRILVSKEHRRRSSNYPSGIPQLALKHSSLSSRSNQKSQNAKGTRQKRKKFCLLSRNTCNYRWK